MGYVTDKSVSMFIHPSDIQKTAGTWTPTLSSNVWGDVRGAADAAFSLAIPIKLYSNAAAYRNCKLKSIDVWYTIGTAAADDFATVELEKMSLQADGTAITGAAVSTTCDTDHDTAAERLAVDEHKMTVTLDTPAFIDEDDVYVLTLTVDAAATTVFTIFGARANFDLVL
ncbi:MAG: hypothetical protein JW908_00605 [Anaerolineales bacterium]|nr:hypothetical protein [Anaerolineales bacterium]